MCQKVYINNLLVETHIIWYNESGDMNASNY